MLRITLNQSVDYLMGKNGKQNMNWPKNDNNKGALKAVSIDNIKKMFRKLIIIGYIDEFLVVSENNVYSRIEISKKGKNYYQNKNNNIENDNEPPIYITIKDQKKKEEIEIDQDEETSEEDIIDESNSKDNNSDQKNNKDKNEESIINSDDKDNNINNEENNKDKSSNKKNKNSDGKKKKKHKNKLDNDEKDYGLCQNKELFDSLFMKLKENRGEILH